MPGIFALPTIGPLLSVVVATLLLLTFRQHEVHFLEPDGQLRRFAAMPIRQPMVTLD